MVSRLAKGGRTRALALATMFGILSLPSPGETQESKTAVQRGEYLFAAGGCANCHTDRKAKAPELSGGPALKTPFGVFYGPNITPHLEQGIGRWTDADFIRALRDGIAPSGAHYFPSFPYTSFTNITDSDLRDLKAYIFGLPPSDRPSKPHEVSFPFNLRFLQVFWRWLNFTPGPFAPDPSKPPEWNRGAYLANALVHCGECHTPRNLLGGLDREMWYAGTADGPVGGPIPNITPEPVTGIGKWSEDDLEQYLAFGLHPSGDSAGGLMAEVVEFGTSKLTNEDIKAIITYVRSLPPIRHALGRQR
jgi:mono/diheme cytochrome c family protein